MTAESKIEAAYPLSPMQEGFLFNTLYAPASGVDIIQVVCDLHEKLDPSAFQQAWVCLTARHTILRTRFQWQQSETPQQIVHTSVPLPWGEEDWRSLSPLEQEGALAAYTQADRQQGFELSQAPLFRLALFRLAKERYQLVWSFHHILLDGRSLPLLLQELFSLYEAIGEDRPISPAQPRPYQEYITWLQGQDFAQAEPFWRQYLAGSHGPGQLPSFGPPALAGQPAGHDQAIQLMAAETAGLESFAARHNLTLNTLVQGAWALLLGRYSQAEEVVFGATRACRRSAVNGAEEMVGLFINTLPVRATFSFKEVLVPWLQALRAQERSVWPYEQTPLVRIQEWSHLPAGQPLFESALVFARQSLDTTLRALGGKWANRRFHLLRRPSYPLTLMAFARPTLDLKLFYDSGRFPHDLITRMLAQLKTLLLNMAAAPQQRLGDISLLTPAEEQELLVSWNQTRTAYPRQSCIHRLFEQQAEQSPAATALIFQGQVLTYQALNQQANQLARHLQSLGVGPEEVVALALERSPEMVVATLAILKAGAAYLPLDMSYPPKRLAFMLQETGARLVLTQEEAATRLPLGSLTAVCLDRKRAAIQRHSRANLDTVVSPDNLAYVMYTSGSTGRPKGVCVPHRAVVRLVKETNYADFGPDQVFLQVAPISFDAATLELWGSLLNGARLVIAPPEALSLAELGRVIRQARVTTLWLTAGLFHLIVDQQLEDLRPLRQLLAGGDVLSLPHVERVLNALPGCRLINGYGPTENTTFTACYPVPVGKPIGRSVPIGRPVANTTLFILDESLRPVPVGMPGELYTGGDGLARGYFRRPAQTAESFIPNPFAAGEGGKGTRLYKTGDRVRYLPGGQVEFLGRMDNQIKIRGFRIEPGEIEAVLGQHPAVQMAAVLALNEGDGASGSKQLVAYVVPASPEVNEASLGHFLRERLPDYMIPAGFVFLEALPLNPNGKVDLRTLPAPERSDKSRREFIPPQTAVEKELAAGWQSILEVEKISRHDNFFQLGGHSLRATRLAAWISATFQADLPLQAIFTAPTLASMAQHIAETTGTVIETTPIIPVARHTRRLNRSTFAAEKSTPETPDP